MRRGVRELHFLHYFETEPLIEGDILLPGALKEDRVFLQLVQE